MASDVDKAARRIDRAIDRYADDIGYATLEILLQKRAQDCRELSFDQEELDPIDFEDVEGYSE
jgi:hypothetical protein